MYGDIIEADKGIAVVNASDYDALLVPGGFSPDILRINPDNSAFAKEFFTEDKPVFSICHGPQRSEEHTSELQSRGHLVCRLLLEKKKQKKNYNHRNNIRLQK